MQPEILEICVRLSGGFRPQQPGSVQGFFLLFLVTLVVGAAVLRFAIIYIYMIISSNII